MVGVGGSWSGESGWERERGKGGDLVVGGCGVGWGEEEKEGTHQNVDLSPRPVRLKVCKCFSAN